MVGYLKILGLGLAVSAIAAVPAAYAVSSSPVLHGGKNTGNGSSPTDELYLLEQQKQSDSIAAAAVLSQSRPYQAARKSLTIPQPLGPRVDDCLQTLNPLCLLTEATAQAHAVGDRDRRDWALADIVVSYSERGAPDRAMAVAAAIEDPRRALRSLVSAGLIHMPDTGSDLLLKGLLTEDTDRNVWIGAAEKRDWETAFTLIEGITEARFRSVAWSRVARHAEKSGSRAMALKALSRAEDDIAKIRFTYGKAFAQYEAALVQHELLHADTTARADAAAWRAVLTAAQSIALPHLRADMLRRVADTAPPSLTAEVNREADRALVKIASKLRRVFVLTGPTKTARSLRRAAILAGSIENPLERARAFVRLANTGITQ